VAVQSAGTRIARLLNGGVGGVFWPLVAGVAGLAQAGAGSPPHPSGRFRLVSVSALRYCSPLSRRQCVHSHLRGAVDGGRNGAGGVSGVGLEKLPCAGAEATAVGWGRDTPPGSRGEISARRRSVRGFQVANAGGCAGLVGGRCGSAPNTIAVSLPIGRQSPRQTAATTPLHLT
ncbi:hypothetical protein TraAM80_10539, partial [Trypanosoma rangeli]